MVMRLPAGEIARAVGSSIDPTFREKSPSGYSIDSRTLQSGDCFIAIRGPRFDGHQFIPEAVRKGASLLIVSRKEAGRSAAGTPCIWVEDTLQALQKLAGWVRRRWGKPLVGITGSVGKTTAKEIASHLLAGSFRVFKNRRNPQQPLRAAPLSASVGVGAPDCCSGAGDVGPRRDRQG